MVEKYKRDFNIVQITGEHQISLCRHLSKLYLKNIFSLNNTNQSFGYLYLVPIQLRPTLEYKQSKNNDIFKKKHESFEINVGRY